MAYNGYLIRIGNYEFPSRYIVFKTYKAAYNVQDLDPYRDGNGVLHRNALAHIPPTCEFQLRSGMTNLRFDEIMNNLRANYTIPLERKANVSVFIPELGGYVETEMYMKEPEVTIIRQESNSVVIYDTITLKFVGY